MRYVNQVGIALKALRSLEGELSLPLSIVLLALAEKPGLSINALAEELGLPQQTASRYVSVLQGRYQPLGTAENTFAKKPLVALGINADDPRKRAIELTAEGEQRVRAFVELLFGRK